MENKDVQHIHIYMDDSGKISKTEDYAVFGGIAFCDKESHSKFANKYKSIIKEIKCKYCRLSNSSCNKKLCPEVKANFIRRKDRRRLMNLSKNFITFGTVIYNKALYPRFFSDKASKGRYIDYAQKRVIKEVILYMIRTKMIDPCKPINLHINIDEMPTKSNGYYTLAEGIKEELKYGVVNYNYGCLFKPIVYNDLKVTVKYVDSKHNCYIQMADIIANTFRREFITGSGWIDTCNKLTTSTKINIILKLPN